MLNRQIITIEVNSQILTNNPLGDPTLREMPVYVPPDYHDTNYRYPVIWALPAFMSWGQRMFNLQAWDENLPQRADRLIRTGAMPPVIIAFPNAFTRYGGSQYVNSSAVGSYEDYVIHELVPHIDHEFRTLAGADHRAVMGHSSGGFGALWLAMRHPDTFTAVASHAGDLAFEYAYLHEIPAAVRTLTTLGGLDAFFASFNATYKSKDWFSALNMIAMSACYSPNPDAPHGFDLPFDPYTGALREAIWQRWLSFDPVRIATSHLDALRSLRAVYIDCGSRDEYGLFLGARMLHKTLDQHTISHTYEEFDGGHGGSNWRYARSLPILASAISAASS